MSALKVGDRVKTVPAIALPGGLELVPAGTEGTVLEIDREVDLFFAKWDVGLGYKSCWQKFADATIINTNNEGN